MAISGVWRFIQIDSMVKCSHQRITKSLGLRELVIGGDGWLAAACERLKLSPPGLLIFVFHGLFESAAEIARNAADPQQAVTTGMFRAFVGNLRAHNYRFVSPSEIVDGLDPAGRFAMITFDDGYANNRRALPVMEEFEAPAVFCISAQHVATGKPFWWDVLYREARLCNWTHARLVQTRQSLKRLRTDAIEQRLIAEFGRPAFRTITDTDRPFSERELSVFASHRLVHIGNHTFDHAILTNYPLLEVGEQIVKAQDWLQEITGRALRVIAYPNGNVSELILRAVRDAGLALGLTGQPGRNTIASTRSPVGALVLKRHTLWGFRSIAAQCRVARSPFSLQATLAGIRARVAGNA